MAQRRVSVEVDAQVGPFVSGLTRAGVAAKAFSKELESADSRMANLVQSGLALAPALVPIGGAAIPALAGLTTQLGFAVTGAATAVLAFQGVGDALDAVNDYSIEPSAENFEKLQQEMAKLGPAGQEFVLFLQDLRPEMQRLQDVAQMGMLPGLQNGISELMNLMPQVESMIATVSRTMGDLFESAGENLNDARWREFYDYLEREAHPTMIAMGETLGYVTEGFANMVMAFDPLADDFTSGMRNAAEAFADWSANLSATEGFQDFIAYIRDTAPDALEALGALGGAMVSLIEAAAPVGEAVLPIIEALAEGISALADSAAGPALVSIAAFIGMLGRLQAISSTVGGGFIGGMFSKAVKPIRDASAAVDSYDRNQQRATMSVTAFAEAEEKRSRAIRSGVAQIGKAGALVGAFAVAQSDLAESTGLANTATYGLMGTLAGPWGAAIGAGVGLTMDFASANNDMESSIEAAGNAARSAAVDFMAQGEAARQALEAAREFRDIGNDPMGGFSNFKAGFIDAFTNSAEEGVEAARDWQIEFLALRQGAADFYAALNDGDLSMLNATDEELSRFVSEIAPAVTAAGLDIREVLTSREGWDRAVEAVGRYNAQMDSASGRSAAVGDALADLESQMMDNATAADALKDAMDNLFGVELSQSEATDAWRRSLMDLEDQIAETNGTIKGGSEVALDNRAAIRDSVEALQDRIAADARAGVSGDKLVETLMRGREAIQEQAEAAGASGKQVQKYLDQLGMTPDNIATIIQTPGLLEAKDQIKALRKLYDLTPKEVRTLVAQAGIDPSMAKIRELAKLYDLTPKQVQTIIEAVDNASGAIRGITQSLINLDGRTARTYVTTVYNDQYNRDALGGPQKYATGGTVAGQRTPYGDKVLTFLAPGEEVISNRHGQADRHRELLKAINAGSFADGGTVGLARGGTVSYDLDQRLELTRLQQQINQLRRDLSKSGDDSLKGLSRQIARLELQSTQRELRAARRTPVRERREELRGTIGGLRDARGGFALDADMSVADVRAEIADFRKEIREAGGEWTKSLQNQSRWMVKHSQAINSAERAIERETEKRERMQDTLDDATRSFEDLQRTMHGFRDDVAGNFLSDPFNLSIDTPAAPPPPSAELVAARGNLSDAKARYKAALGMGGDPLQRSYEASRILAEMDQYQAQVDELERAQESAGRFADNTEQAVTGLEAFKRALESDIERAERWGGLMDSLLGKGLDPNGGLFAQLATSGDFATASGLAGLTAGEIDQYEALWTRREEVVLETATRAMDAVYREESDRQVKELQRIQTNIDRSSSFIEKQTNVIERRSEKLENTVKVGMDRLQSQIGGLRTAVANVSREQETNRQKRGKR